MFRRRSSRWRRAPRRPLPLHARARGSRRATRRRTGPASSCGPSCLRLPHIFLDILRQHIERDVAALDDDVVAIAQVLLGAKRLLCTPHLAHDLVLPDLVPARLPPPAATPNPP